MNVTEAINQINISYRGSDDDVPVVGSIDYNMWLSTINRKVSEWARDSKNTWQSLFEIRSIGTVSVGTQEYDLEDDFLIPADSVTITTTDNNILRYVLVKPQERGRYNKSVYISGREPKQLTFNDAFETGQDYIGGTINLGAYYIPEELTDGSDDIPVDDPYWIVYAVASELAFNDLTYSDKSPDLVGKANFLYSQMAASNRKGTNDNPRVARTNVNRIRDTRYNYGEER